MRREELADDGLVPLAFLRSPDGVRIDEKGARIELSLLVGSDKWEPGTPESGGPQVLVDITPVPTLQSSKAPKVAEVPQAPDVPEVLEVAEVPVLPRRSRVRHTISRHPEGGDVQASERAAFDPPSELLRAMRTVHAAGEHSVVRRQGYLPEVRVPDPFALRYWGKLPSGDRVGARGGSFLSEFDAYGILSSSLGRGACLSRVGDRRPGRRADRALDHP
jgi:hypothetical protein